MRAPFTPTQGATQSITVAGTSASATVAVNTGNVALVSNVGTGLCYFRYGIGAQTAVTTDCPILPSQAFTVSIPDNTAVVFAAIQDSAGTTLKITPGYGV